MIMIMNIIEYQKHIHNQSMTLTRITAIRRTIYKTYLYTQAVVVYGGSFACCPALLTLNLELHSIPYFNTTDMIGRYVFSGVMMAVPIAMNFVGTGLIQNALRA